MNDQETEKQVPVQALVSNKTLAYICGGGLVAGALIVLGAILPAEYNADPLGLGKATGLSRLWAPDTKDFAGQTDLNHVGEKPRTTLIVDIPLGAGGWDEAELEYKVGMVEGQGALYKWSAETLDGQPLGTPVEYDLHGHDVVGEDEEETVIEYLKGDALSQEGSFVAPLEGTFGWYFKNHDPEPVVIHMEVTGFFDVIEPGEPGNEFRIRPIDVR